ncbi:MAG: hypothetical protein PHN19_02035 [Patescibacteria group bacterium]|nr:hypothetical protein [Patescibacteria group bacterium]
MATKKILSKLFISMIALFILFPSISFAKGSVSATLTVTATVVKPTTLQISKVTTKGVVSDKTSTVTYNAVSDVEPIIEVKKEIIKGQFVEIVTITF